MENLSRRIALVLVLVLASLAGCATTGPQFQAAQQIPEGRALVYVYREAGFVGAGVTYMVRANGIDVATLPAGGYFEYHAVPGELELSAKTEAKTSVTIDAEAGKTYYVKGSVGVGVFVGHPHLAVVPSDVGAREIVACNLVPGARSDGAAAAAGASGPSGGPMKTAVVQVQPDEIAAAPAAGAEVRVEIVDRRSRIVLERTTIGDTAMSGVAFQPSEMVLLESIITRSAQAAAAELPEAARVAPVVCEVNEFSVTTPATALYWDATTDIALTLRVAGQQRQLTGHGVKRTYAWPSEKIIATAARDALRQVSAAADRALRELLAAAPAEEPTPEPR